MRLVSIVTPALCLFLASCAHVPKDALPAVAQVDLPRFMGDWYVIASIPTFLEKSAYNAVESYRLEADGTIATTFTFYDGSFTGPEKTLKPRGWVRDASHALWGMQFIWPLKAEYRIAYLDAAYSETIIARSARDYVWIMARTPTLTPEDYRRLVATVEKLGYEVGKLRAVPQRWTSF
jgi:apolipoprotein D and lipocalin family protein